MRSYALTLPSTRHDTARRAWAVLTLAALWPVWSIAHAMPGFLIVEAPATVDRSPGLWSIVHALPWVGDVPLAGLAMASAIGAGAWLAALFVARPPRGNALIPAALLIALTIPALLPSTELIDFLPAIMLVAVARRPVIAALVIGGNLLATVGAAPLGAVAIIAAIVLTARPFLASPANDNGLPINLVYPYPA